jgi:phage repressor protein C with HTH and peptisase S24 domain
MTKSEMLIKIRECFDYKSNTEFAEKLGISPQNLNNWFKRETFDAEVIKSKLPKINSEWLLTGFGNMLNLDGPTSEIINDHISANMVSLIPVSVQAGRLNDFVQSEAFKDCQLIASPIKDVDFAITVAGDSMEPDYPSGSILLIKRINEQAFIDWGKTYVIDTCNGVIVKEIHKGKKDGEVECYSINPNPKYATYSISLSDVFGIYKVVMCMTLK